MSATLFDLSATCLALVYTFTLLQEREVRVKVGLVIQCLLQNQKPWQTGSIKG